MEYVCVEARFRFFNGQKWLTVEYSYSLASWFVFEGDSTTGALWNKKIKTAKSKSPNRAEAELILGEFLEIMSVRHGA